MNSSRVGRKKTALVVIQLSRSYLSSYIFYANTFALDNSRASALTSFSDARSYHHGGSRYGWPKTAPIVGSARDRYIPIAPKPTQTEWGKYHALLMANDDIICDEQFDINIEFDTHDKNGNATNTKPVDGNGNNINEYFVPGSKKLDYFFSLPIVDVAQAALVLLSSLLVALGTLENLNAQASNAILTAEDIIGEIFFLDFLARWYSKAFKLNFLLNPFSILDAVFILPVLLRGFPSLAAILPSALSSSAGLINLRLLRVLRLQLVLTDLETFSNFEMALGLRPSDIKPYQLQLARVFLSVFTLLSVSTGLIYTSEHTANPTAFPDYFTALYFGLTTLTTVGFGDIVPITFNGRLVVCGSILVGVAVVPIQAAAFFEALLDFQKEQQMQDNIGENRSIELEQKVTDSSISLPPSNNDSITSINKSSPNKGDYYSRELFIDCSCKMCKATPHRRDAFFCWRCGASLTSSVENDVNAKSPS